MGKRFVWVLRWTGLLALCMAGAVHASTVKGMRFWQSPERTRVVLDLTGPVEHRVFTLKNPDRVVIDLPKTGFSLELDAVKIDSDLVSRVRKSVQSKNDTLRLVLDLKRSAEAKAFLLKPYLQYGHRLVIDLSDGKRRATAPTRTARAGDVIVAVDAGHGGEDPGAIGYTGKKEKHITLAIAKALVDELNRQTGVSAFLTRSGDYYIGLRKRTELARQRRAHLFVSIHADAFKDKRVRGASVWTLSTKGSNSELGKWLESRENVDLLGVADDLDLAQFDAQVAQVLVSLSLEYALGSSIEMASNVLRQVGRINKLHSQQPRQAAFVVLKQPSVPSILVETGFISNPTDERNLSSPSFQRKLARALAKGVSAYLADHPPEGTKLALAKRGQPIRHRVHRGDTLSGIARSYGVSVSEIQKANDLQSFSLRAGQTLIIPRS